MKKTKPFPSAKTKAGGSKGKNREHQFLLVEIEILVALI